MARQKLTGIYIPVVTPLNEDESINFAAIDEVAKFLAENGVDGITADDLDITIENGNIIAPQGTRVFNMSGMETGTENLAPGIYIVRVGSKALKVVVR